MTQNPTPPEDVREELETKPFLSHLEDLRWMIIRCVGALLVGVIACAFGARQILEALYIPYEQTGHNRKDLFNLGVVDPFSIHMEISVLGGLIFALPAMLYFIGQFLLPALTIKERRFLGPVFGAGAMLFIVGVGFCYTFVLRIALQFFFSYSDYLGMTANWTAKALVDFEVQMLLGFGIAFEFPLVLLVLNFLGIISAAQMASKRRHAAFVMFLAATCIIPTTDPISLSLLAVPLYILFEACIWIARIFERRRAAQS